MFYFFFEDEKTTASILAKYVLKTSSEPLNNLKLQRILYYIQGYYMSKYGHPLFPDEIHAWKFGPVVPNVYQEYSIFDSEVLEKPIDNIELDCSLEELELINWVIKEKSSLSIKTLNKITQLEDPWLIATNNGSTIRPGLVIDKENIKKYFTK